MTEDTQQFKAAGTSIDKQQDSALQISVRAWIALILVSTVCFMAVFEKPIEEPLYSLSIMAIGFYFGQKITKPATTL